MRKPTDKQIRHALLVLYRAGMADKSSMTEDAAMTVAWCIDNSRATTFEQDLRNDKVNWVDKGIHI